LELACRRLSQPDCLHKPIAPVLTKTCVVKGKDAVPFLEKLVVGDVQGIPNGSGSLSVFTNEKGGIIDDTVITKVWPLEVHKMAHSAIRLL
jgi:glycine cleavage system aminomethyltransferase T